MHIEGNIFQVPDRKLICEDHDDILKAVQASKLDNEPGGKSALSSSEATSTCSSSPSHSDSDGSGTEGSEIGLKQKSGLDEGESDGMIPRKRGRPVKKAQESKAEEILESTSRDMLSPKQKDPTTDTNKNNIPTTHNLHPSSTPSADTGTNLSVTENGEGAKDTVKSPTAKKAGRKSLSDSRKDSMGTTGKASRNKKNGGNEMKEGRNHSHDETSDEDFPNLVIDIPQ